MVLQFQGCSRSNFECQHRKTDRCSPSESDVKQFYPVPRSSIWLIKILPILEKKQRSWMGAAWKMFWAGVTSLLLKVLLLCQTLRRFIILWWAVAVNYLVKFESCSICVQIYDVSFDIRRESLFGSFQESFSEWRWGSGTYWSFLFMLQLRDSKYMRHISSGLRKFK